MEKTNQPLLSHAELLELKRWNTPTIYNGWEQIQVVVMQSAPDIENVHNF